MRTFALGLSLAAISAAVPARPAVADDDDDDDESGDAVAFDKTKVIGVDGAAVLPVGDWGDGAGIGVGALGRLDIPVLPKLTVTVRAGLVYHMPKDVMGTDVSTMEIPVLGGVRYAFRPNLYGASELGLVWIRTSLDGGGMSQSDSNTELGMSLAGGWRSGKLDVRAGVYFPEVADAMGMFVTVGYDVSSL
jgi:hypothetical protein